MMGKGDRDVGKGEAMGRRDGEEQNKEDKKK